MFCYVLLRLARIETEAPKPFTLPKGIEARNSGRKDVRDGDGMSQICKDKENLYNYIINYGYTYIYIYIYIFIFICNYILFRKMRDE